MPGLKANPLPAQPTWLRAGVDSKPVGVDREKNVINGRVVAQEGLFKSEGRGQFSRESLRTIVRLMKAEPNGLKSRFGHPNLSNDGLGKYLGRDKNPRLDTILKPVGDGTFKELQVVRADLHIDKTALEPMPDSGKPLGQYVMDLAESDPEAFSSSLVLKYDEKPQLDSSGRPAKMEDGEQPPAIWIPTELHAIDVVDTGDAVDGFLSADSLPDSLIRQATTMLHKAFAGVPYEVAKTRIYAFADKALANEYGLSAGEPEVPAESPPPVADAGGKSVEQNERDLKLAEVQ